MVVRVVSHWLSWTPMSPTINKSLLSFFLHNFTSVAFASPSIHRLLALLLFYKYSLTQSHRTPSSHTSFVCLRDYFCVCVCMFLPFFFFCLPLPPLKQSPSPLFSSSSSINKCSCVCVCIRCENEFSLSLYVVCVCTL